jgi:hypothetical protein
MASPDVARSQAAPSSPATAEPVTAGARNGGFGIDAFLDAPVPSQVLARVGAEFQHLDDTSAQRRYRITPGGGFLVTASSDGRGVGTVEFRHDNRYKEAWQTLAGYVVRNTASIPVTVQDAPRPAPAAGGPAAAPAPRPGAGIGGAIDRGVAAITNATHAIADAIHHETGGAHEGTTTPAPAAAQSAHAPAAPSSGAGIPAMSQYHWYGYDGRPLNVDEVLAAATAISSAYGFGGSPEKVTEPSDEAKKLDGNQGYFWFKADGTPAENSERGTQYVTFVTTGLDALPNVNPLVNYLSSKPPGDRPATSAQPIAKKTDVPEAIQSLDLRNIPGLYSCFATSASMMAPAGVHAVGSTDAAGIKIVTGEKADDNDNLEVTCDAAASRRARRISTSRPRTADRSSPASPTRRRRSSTTGSPTTGS